MFRNDKFPGFGNPEISGHPYNLLEYFQNENIVIQIKLCRNSRIQMDLSKNNRFSTEEAINYILRTEKRKKVAVCEMLQSSGPCTPPFFQFYHGN